MKWVTREKVKVDRVACPWLIRKFIDQKAQFLFVSADKVSEVAKSEGATPYDVPGVEFGHHGVIDVFDTATMHSLGNVATEKGAHTLALAPASDQVYAFLPQTCRAAIYQVHAV